MKALDLKKTVMLAAIGAAFALPVAASADPSAGVWSGDAAAPVPHIPGPFATSPTNDDQSKGQFTATFDANGFVSAGRPAEPPAVIEVSQANGGSRMMAAGNGDSAASETEFARFRAQLKSLTLANRPSNSLTAQR